MIWTRWRLRPPSMCGICCGFKQVERKQSFFEKKDQKTFDRRTTPPTDKSFLVLFFKKELLVLL